MVAVVWRFGVDPRHREAFERFCGAGGEWTALARRSRSYLGSSFLRDVTDADTYLLTEYWSEMVVYERHVTSLQAEIDGLSRRRSELTVSQEALGIFQVLDVPDRTGPAWSRRSG